MDNLVGQNLGPYRLLALVRRDGVTVDYKAQELSTGRTVTVALISPSLARDEALRERLRRETQTMRRLRHAHIVPLYEYGLTNGQAFLVLGYVEGRTLRERLSDGMLSLSEVNRITAQVGTALDHAHQQGIVHGDVRPGNVLVDTEGTAFLTGFGLTRIIGVDRGPGWLGIGAGTPAYASPEQARGQSIGPRSDVYSLGVMLYEMTTGCLPHTADTPLGVALKYVEELPLLPRTHRPDLPEDVEQVVLKAMATEPEQRFQSAGEVTRALDEATQTEGSMVSAPYPPLPSRKRPATKWQWPIEWGVLSAVIGTLAIALFLLFALSRLPIRVQIEGSQLEVVRVIEQTATPAPALGEAEPTETASSVPTFTPSATPEPTVTNTPFITATPAQFATTTPLPPVVDERARAFAEPILASISGRPPDFSTNFESVDPEWSWQVVSTDPDDAYFEIVDGAARMELVDRADVQLSHPRLETTDFVLSVESRQISGASGSEQKVFLHFASTYLQFIVMSGTRHWGLALPWHPEGGFGGQGMAVHPIGETNHTLMVVRDSELAVYLNDVPITHLHEPNLDTLHRIAFWCTGAPDIVCEFGNVQFWDLAD